MPTSCFSNIQKIQPPVPVFSTVSQRLQKMKLPGSERLSRTGLILVDADRRGTRCSKAYLLNDNSTPPGIHVPSEQGPGYRVRGSALKACLQSYSVSGL